MSSNNKQKEKSVIISVAIVGIVVLESIALAKGINGVFLTLSIVAISGLGGYQLKNIIGRNNNK